MKEQAQLQTEAEAEAEAKTEVEAEPWLPPYPVASYSTLDSYLTSVLHERPVAGVYAPHLAHTHMHTQKEGIGGSSISSSGYTDNHLYPHYQHVVPRVGHRSHFWQDIVMQASHAHAHNIDMHKNHTHTHAHIHAPRAVRVHNEDRLGVFMSHITRQVHRNRYVCPRLGEDMSLCACECVCVSLSLPLPHLYYNSRTTTTTTESTPA